MIISAELRASVDAYVLAEFPKEACGFVVDGAFVPAQNIALDPEQDFLVSNVDYLRAKNTGKLQAILHSHPNGPLHPSKADMKSQVNTDLPWIIVMSDGKTVHYDWTIWGGDTPVPPILGRTFLHGVRDCYSLIRDTYRLGREKLAFQNIVWPLDPIELPEGPRDDEWWNVTDDDLYTDNFKPAGFFEIEAKNIRPGDIFFMKIRSEKMNHGGVLLNNFQIMHHLPLRVSRREQAGIYGANAAMWIRHEAAR
jgi:proteasome lid subunit RPN8/RPN11